MDILYDIYNSLRHIAIELVVFGIIFFIFERLRPVDQKTPFFKKDFKVEVTLAIVNLGIFMPLFAFLVVFMTEEIGQRLLPHQIFETAIAKISFGFQIFIAAAIVDFSTYWRHRLTHMFMWSFHSIHHSAKQISWITALRLHPVDFFVAIIFDALILYVLGFGGAAMFWALVITKAFNYFVHSNINVKFAWPVCYFLSSPHFHRWHHANEKEAFDKNFCAVFPFWDLIFGTYYYPTERLPKGYGLRTKEQAAYENTLWGTLKYPFQRFFKKK